MSHVRGARARFHVYLESPLGDRTVIDGVSGDAVPYKNVYAALGRGPGALRSL